MYLCLTGLHNPHVELEYFCTKNWVLIQKTVCEIGQWKNSTAFHAHYLRLGAIQQASKAIQLVHNASPPANAAPEWLHTPGRHAQGGSNQEGGAQEGGEPEPSHPKRKKSRSPPKPKRKYHRGGDGPMVFRFARRVSEEATPTSTQKQ